MGKAADNVGSSAFHRGWIGLALAVLAVAAIVLFSSQGSWISRQFGLNRQATALEAMTTPPGGGDASMPTSQPDKSKKFCPT
jgi:hypothetical protein